MQFMGRLANFEVALNGFDLEPDDRGIGGTIDISFTGKPGAPAEYADYMDALIRYSAVRDPFAIGDPIPLANVETVLGDLTWSYHLTSIWQVGAERVATIDGRDYRPGDKLNQLLVVAIDPSGVRLSAPDQKLIQHLHF